jgi:hypothetical protein
MLIWARFRRFLHCLWHAHRSVDWWQESLSGEVRVRLLCECGREFGGRGSW